VPGQLKHRTALVAPVILSHALTTQNALAITAGGGEKVWRPSRQGLSATCTWESRDRPPKRNITRRPGLFQQMRGQRRKGS